MPSFCRHNRLIQNCPICSREQAVEMRPVVSSSAPKVAQPPAPRPTREDRPAPSGRSARLGERSLRNAAARGVTVRRMARGADDGYHHGLVPGLKSSSDAARLAEELAFAAGRLAQLAADPPGLYATVAAEGDVEERIWLAFTIAYVGPASSEDPLDEPFAPLEAARVPWGQPLPVEGVIPGPRGAYDPARVGATVEAYQAWAGRSGSQAAAFLGETAWSPERRFARIFERLGTLPGLSRDVRFDLLVTLGALDVVALRAGALQFGGENEATVAAKRVFGIGDPLLLERRAADLAEAAGLELAALDLGLHNWGTGVRVRGGLEAGVEPDEDSVGVLRDVLGL